MRDIPVTYLPAANFPGTEQHRMAHDLREAERFANTPRGRLEALIDHCVDLLDHIDGDENLEAETDAEVCFDGEERFQPATLLEMRA